MNKDIRGFFGEYRPFSNYHMHAINYKNRFFPSNENAFHCEKCANEEEKDVFSTVSPNLSKSLGRKVKLREDWDSIRKQVMFEINVIKFKDPELRALLLSTDNYYLEETNTWHDNYWGSCTCDRCGDKGSNNLGLILMMIRDNIRKEENL